MARMWASAGRLVTAWRKSLESDVRKMQDQSFQIQTLLCFQKPSETLPSCEEKSAKVLRSGALSSKRAPLVWRFSGLPLQHLGDNGAVSKFGMAPLLWKDRTQIGKRSPSGYFRPPNGQTTPCGLAVRSAQVVVAVVPGGAGEAAFVQPGQAILDINGCQMMVRNSVGTTGNPCLCRDLIYCNYIILSIDILICVNLHPNID